jgi:hypothetical protein
MPPINANVTNQQITASVGETQIDVSVAGGFGPSGANGAQGIQGIQGPAGPAGATGATGPAGTTTWAGITDRPATFPPSSHNHVAANITDFAAAVAAVSPGGGGSYTLPNATTSTLGGVIVGAGLSVSSGTVSANLTSVAGRTGAVTIAAADVSGLDTLAIVNALIFG